MGVGDRAGQHPQHPPAAPCDLPHRASLPVGSGQWADWFKWDSGIHDQGKGYPWNFTWNLDRKNVCLVLFLSVYVLMVLWPYVS